MKLRSTSISIILHSLLIMTVYVFQGMVFPYLRVNGLVPLLLPIVVAGVSVYEGGAAGGITGIFAGVLCDISVDQPAGVFTLLFTLTGVLIGYLSDTVITRSLLTFFCSSAALLVVSAFAQLFPLLFFDGLESGPLFEKAMRQTLYSLIYAIPLAVPVTLLGKRTGRAQEIVNMKYYSAKQQ